MESMLNRIVHPYKLKNFQEFVKDRKITVWYGLETISYRYPQHWSLLLETLKETNSLSQFKRNIRQWVCDDCPCSLCKTYVQNLGFLCKNVCICMNTHICICMYVYVYIYVYIYIYIYVYIYIN